MLRVLVLFLFFVANAEQIKEIQVEEVTHNDVVSILEEASQVKVSHTEESKGGKEADYARHPAPPPPNLPEPPAF